jgi:hypothetical protein
MPDYPNPEASPAAQDPVWGNLWNPEPNVFAPSSEDPGVWGLAEPSHGDVMTAAPMVDAPGDPRTYRQGGSGPDVRANLLTDVRARSALPPPMQVVRHEVHTYETGAEGISVRQYALMNVLLPLQLLEANPRRKRALVRIVPSSLSQAVQTQTPNNPAAGASATLTVPPGQTWQVQSVSFTDTTSAAVANRFPFVQAAHGASILAKVQDPTALTATQVGNYALFPTAALAGHTGASPFSITMPFPAVTMVAGDVLTIGAAGMDAADQISAVVVQVLVTSGVNPNTTGISVFIAPRDQTGVAAQSSWYKLVQGDPPLEIKTQEGVDAILDAAGTVNVQMWEELFSEGDLPGIGVS